MNQQYLKSTLKVNHNLILLPLLAPYISSEIPFEDACSLMSSTPNSRTN